MNINKIQNLNDLNKIIKKETIEKLSYYLSISLFIIPIFMFLINLIIPSETKTIWLTLVLLLGFFSLVNCFLYIYKIYNKFGKKYIINILKNNKYIVFLFLYIICCFISCLFSSNKFISFFGSDYLSEGFICYLAYIGIFFNGLISKNKGYLKNILIYFIFTVSFISVVTLISYYFNLNFNFIRNFTSIFMNENHYAYYLTMGLICNACMFLFCNKKDISILYLILYIINGHTLILNNTLGCFLAFLCTLFLIFIYLVIVKQDFFKFLIIILITVILCIINIKIVLPNFTQLTNDVISIEENISNSGDIQKIYGVGTNRMGLWLVGLEFIKEKPIFGYGIDNLLDQYIRFNKSEITSRPHNEYIQIAATIGIPGLIFYLSFLLLLFFKIIFGIKKISYLEITVVFIPITYLISAFFGVSTFNATPYLYLFLGLIGSIFVKKVI